MNSLAKFVSLRLLAFGLLGPSAALAHGGGLDSLGCHHNRKAGGYHCHQGALAGRQFNSKNEASDALRAIERGAKTQKQSAELDKLTGRASVIDGDTLEIHGQRIRLHGIDAPESGQTCADGTGRNYRCGQKAALALADKIGQRTVSCEQRDVDQYRRVVAICRAGQDNLNAWLVREGWAVAYRRFSKDYVQAEEEARGANRGIWAGAFTMPEEWRRSRR